MTFQNRFLLLLFTPLFFSACISNKKHLEAIDLSNAKHLLEVNNLQGEINTANEKIKQLELNVAERIGENNILLMLRDELQLEIATLQSNMKNLSSSSTSTQKNLSANLAQKDQKIAELKDYLAEVETTISEHESIIQNIAGDLNYIAQDYPNDMEVSLSFDFATLDIQEAFLFKKNSSTRLIEDNLIVIEKFSEIFQKYPNLKVQIIGHTDTAPPKDKKRYGDNWNFSALQSATIVRTFIDEYDVNANQLTLAAKAEFSPKASNATSDGKLKNRRIEFHITMDSEDLAKKVRGILSMVRQ